MHKSLPPACPEMHESHKLHPEVMTPKAIHHPDPAARKLVFGIFLLALTQRRSLSGALKSAQWSCLNLARANCSQNQFLFLEAEKGQAVSPGHTFFASSHTCNSVTLSCKDSVHRTGALFFKHCQEN